MTATDTQLADQVADLDATSFETLFQRYCGACVFRYVASSAMRLPLTTSFEEEDVAEESLDGVVLPGELHAGLVDTVGMHNTGLNKQIEVLGDNGTYGPLVLWLRKLASTYDMKAVGALLEQIPHK